MAIFCSNRTVVIMKLLILFALVASAFAFIDRRADSTRHPHTINQPMAAGQSVKYGWARDDFKDCNDACANARDYNNKVYCDCDMGPSYFEFNGTRWMNHIESGWLKPQ